MTKKEQNLKEKSSSEISWLSTSADVRVRVKNGKVYFIIGKGQGFSYSINFFKKLVENNK